MKFKFKLKNIFIILIMFFIGIINVNALNFDMNISNVIENEKDGELTINIVTNGSGAEKIVVELDYDATKIKLTEDKSDNLGYSTNFDGNTLWVNTTTEDFKDGVLAKFKVTNLSSSNEKVTVSIKKILHDDIVYEMNGYIQKEVTLKYVEKTTERIKNTSAKITDLKINNTTMKPAFSSNVKEYKVYVNKDTIKQITILPTYEQTGTTLEVNCTLGCSANSDTPNKLNLVMGKNQATFTITSEDGKNTETYKFIIYRGETTDGSNKLSSLSISGYELTEKFNNEVLDYTATVPYETTTVELVAIPEDENADVKIKGNEDLKVGDNVITITVTSAETTEKKIYNITLTRAEFEPEETTTTTVPIIADKKDDSQNNTLLIVLISLGGAIIIGLAAYFIFFRKPKKQKKTLSKNSVDEKQEVNNSQVINEDKEPTTVDDALRDLMQTKELEIKE